MLSIHALMARERRALERRRITAEDLRRWPRLTDQKPGDIVTGELQIPGKGYVAPVECAYLRFRDPNETEHAKHDYALSHNGEMLAASWQSTDITIWRLRDGLMVQRLRDTANVTAMAFSLDDKHLVSGSQDTNSRVWDVRSGRWVAQAARNYYQVDYMKT